MKVKELLLIMLFFSTALFAQSSDNTITISGRVADFDGNPVDSCSVLLYNSNFTTAYESYTDKDGYYTMSNVAKGRYMAMYVLRIEEYPRMLKVSEDKMRLEFWAWNIIADKDLVINPHYHRLELYGTTVFKQNGGYPTVMIYTRPMSLGRMLTYGEDLYKDKSKAEQDEIDISVEPEDIEFRVWADEQQLTVRSVQPVEEYVGGGRQIAYLIYADLPKNSSSNYNIFRIEGTNKAHGEEKGENVYFYEIPEYEN